VSLGDSATFLVKILSTSFISTMRARFL
jgi:hypothetical protein